MSFVKNVGEQSADVGSCEMVQQHFTQEERRSTSYQAQIDFQTTVRRSHTQIRLNQYLQTFNLYVLFVCFDLSS